MKMKKVTSTMFILLLTNMLTIAFNVVPIVLPQEDVSYEVLDEIGTHFELQHFNVSITTNTTVHIMLRAFSSEMISYFIENASLATSTQLTLGNLKPLTTYYMYEDSYINEIVFTTDDVGSYTYTQDLSQFHHVFIQPRTSTIFISESTTLQSDIYDSVVITADNIVLDLNGYNIVGPGGWWAWIGVDVVNRKNVTIKNGGINNHLVGIYLGASTDIVISNNTIASNVFSGIELSNADSSMIRDNTFTSIGYGLDLGWGSTDNIIYHNNFIDCDAKIWYGPWFNVWDDGYPSGGNYWSDYTGVDLYNGPDQDKPGSDGIGDTPYTIGAYNIDHYPLMNPWTPTETSVKVGGVDYPVVITSNTTIDQIVATKNTLHFASSGPTGETGYINVIFLMVNTTEIKVFIDSVKLTPPTFPVISTNGTHYIIYFEFVLSTHTVAIQFAPVTATIDIDPDILNLESNGEWITAYIELPEGYDVADIGLTTVLLTHNDFQYSAVTDPQYGFVTDPASYLMDHDEDGIMERMVKFGRIALRDYLGEVDLSDGDKFYDVPLTVIGEVAGMTFEGSDTIVVIKN